MQIGTKIHGFTIQRVRELPELGAKLWEMEHDRTGAELIWLERADENKTFSIAFKTLPEDSTGVFHILEHSVLCGSDRYPVKEPFVELLKTSVQTFLNAMTYPDKTVYPISSRNDRDFLNLMDVYLDAVLHPAIYHKPEIFRQEGWRYEQSETGTVYQGVVFNEMKGSFASPYTVLYNAMSELLFPDTCYRFVSGGDPACIPDLSYEQFLAMHRKYYHPSNARISLVGSVDLDAALEKIDSYLQPYDRQKQDFRIPMQQPIAAFTRTLPYEVGQEEPLEERSIVCCAGLLGRFDEQERLFAASILSDYLAGDNDAPLKKAVLSAGLGQDMNVEVEDGMQQTVISWQVWNTDEDKLEAIRRVARETLERIVSEGLDEQRLRACYNHFAFRKRDRDGGYDPRSLTEALNVLDTWLYGGDPAQPLLVEDTLAALERKLDSGYFAALLRELFLDDSHSVTIVLKPSHSLGAEKAEREATRVAAESAAWTEERRSELQREAEELSRWQQTPDSPEALATIPVLKLSDLKERPAPLPLTVTKLGEIPLLRHGTDSKLVAFKTIFNIADRELEELPKIVALSQLLGKMGTDRHSGEDLQMLVKERIGRLEIKPNILSGSDPGRCRVQLAASVVCLAEQAECAAELLREILTGTSYTDRRLLRDLLQQAAMNAQMALASGGQRYATTRVSAYGTAHGAAREYAAGTEYLRWLKKWSTAEDEALDGLLEELRCLAGDCLSADRLTLSCTENTPESLLHGLAAAFPKTGKEIPAEAAYRPLGKGREGIVIPAAVGFAARGANLKAHGLVYRGSIPVLANILNFVYLWSEIRVQGGAYDCGFVGRDDGDFGFYTYRDPQPGRSLGVMDRAAAFIRNFCRESPDLTGYILGSVSTLDPLMTEAVRRDAAESRWFKGITDEDICRWYSELIHTTAADLLALCPALERVAEEKAACVVAGSALLDACGEELESRLSI
ncbi:MAG: insulinase family protein [Oscillospiraceae bacterium]|nr:insulinase family protein [Oscillospiraceae bacterium]